MQIYFYNDKKVFVRLLDKELLTPLMPGEGAVFDVAIKEGQIPFIKIWHHNIVLLADIAPELVGIASSANSNDASNNGAPSLPTAHATSKT